MTLIKSISGIRGTIGGTQGDSLTPIDAVKFAAAYGQWLIENNKDKKLKVVLGRDARPSGEMISNLVCSTLQGLGIDIVDLGLSTTPTVEMMVVEEKAHGGIILTASHNPIQWNALKLLNNKGEFISASDGEKLLEIAEKGDIKFAEVKNLGSLTHKEDSLDKHIKKILDLPLVDVKAIENAKFKIAVDAVNSSGGIAVPKLLEALGVLVIEKINCEPNGLFAHNPEPLPEHLGDIIKTIEKGSYDLGIVVDPDVDRLALISNDGTPFGEEYTLVAVSDYVLSNTKGNTVSNLSSTRALRDVTEKHGGEYFASAVGEVNVVEKMKEVKAVIGGEGNGGIIYPELHYGRDALVGIALFLTHLAKFGKSSSMLRSKYPNYHISKNKIELTPEINVDDILVSVQDKYKKQPVNTIDGVKIEFDKEWVHLRKSNTEPIIRIYSESESLATAEHLAHKIMDDIREIIHHRE
ncbi:phosphoglucosamine mutase [Marinigracilibium pacificum]|uniref:Phosphoglucosamine mutase n=1 Tax=Marinigracilibium pacificum TaxID=2729599 RepID=A0A848IR72_9BACT|nr:phosphoglucosamine mutase [Marinigracilibium pacificum]